MAKVFRKYSGVLVQQLEGRPSPLGVLTSSGASVNNATTPQTFSAVAPGLSGKVLLLYAAVAGRFLPGTSAAVSASSTPGAADAGVPLAAGDRIRFTMGDLDTHLAWIASAAGNLEVWEMT